MLAIDTPSGPTRTTKTIMTRIGISIRKAPLLIMVQPIRSDWKEGVGGEMSVAVSRNESIRFDVRSPRLKRGHNTPGTPNVPTKGSDCGMRAVESTIAQGEHSKELGEI
jgi:hypothetical protein